MSKITNTKKYAILWLDSQGKNSKEISSELKISLDDISTVLLSYKNQNTENKNDVVSRIKTGDLMITHTAGKKVNNVAIMTKEASEHSDANKNNVPPKGREFNNSIYRPKSK